MASEEEERDGASIIYKMKAVQFLGRSVPIVLQNDNGPCPLLAISNVLLLRNNLTLNIDMMEISQRELMSLVAEWLLDANSNVQNKDEEFVKNQQQNIGDAIQLLPRLATGIDVNVRFRHIHDFEFTPECAIFDLFHVGLVHGWLCDPQDKITFSVIGSSSYNTLVEKLVALHAVKAEEAPQQAILDEAILDEEPTVDFAAATVAALGVPRPLLLKRLSSEDFEALNQGDNITRRKGDDEEAAELLQALQLSQIDNQCVPRSPVDKMSDESLSSVDEGIPQLELRSVVLVDKDGVESLVVENEALRTRSRDECVLSTDEGIPDLLITSILQVKKEEVDSTVTEEVLEQEFVLTAETTEEVSQEVPTDKVPAVKLSLILADGKTSTEKIDLGFIMESSSSSSGQLKSFSLHKGCNPLDMVENEGNASIFTVGEDVKATVEPLDLDAQTVEEHNLSTSGSVGSSFEHIVLKEDKLLIDTGSEHLSEVAADCANSGLGDDEPLYEGENSFSDYGIAKIEDNEPLYEGESISEGEAQIPVVEDGSGQDDSRELGEEKLNVAMTEGMIIENFLNSTASQLTYHGLFSLQDGLKNNELYIFFRNNHFSTLFKYEGQIYLLATDQGYLAQPDLVWEKLTEVDGDTVFATGNFQQFQVDQSNGLWNERDAVAATADFMSSQQMSGAIAGGASYNSDLQLAMALQQQEIAQQQQHQHQPQTQPPPSAASRSSQPSSKASTIDAGRLVTGPARSSVPPPKQEKAKEKCTIM